MRMTVAEEVAVDPELNEVGSVPQLVVGLEDGAVRMCTCAGEEESVGSLWVYR